MTLPKKADPEWIEARKESNRLSHKKWREKLTPEKREKWLLQILKWKHKNRERINAKARERRAAKNGADT